MTHRYPSQLTSEHFLSLFHSNSLTPSLYPLYLSLMLSFFLSPPLFIFSLFCRERLVVRLCSVELLSAVQKNKKAPEMSACLSVRFRTQRGGLNEWDRNVRPIIIWSYISVFVNYITVSDRQNELLLPGSQQLCRDNQSRDCRSELCQEPRCFCERQITSTPKSSSHWRWKKMYFLLQSRRSWIWIFLTEIVEHIAQEIKALSVCFGCRGTFSAFRWQCNAHIPVQKEGYWWLLLVCSCFVAAF